MYEVRSFGRDCLGNVSGYVVKRGHGWRMEIAATFPASAESDARDLCHRLNGVAQTSEELRQQLRNSVEWQPWPAAEGPELV